MNNRKTKRYLKDNSIEVILRSTGNETTGVAVNLSRKGVDICCQKPPEIGSEVFITFQFENEKKRTVFESVRGKVKWTKKLGLNHAGVEFLSEMNEKNHSGILSRIEEERAIEGER
ncbi:MAG TPA: PilZ domain-containing protein [Candidatus Manganitrophaceae bacterium]|nr:PilZ domain-containing protein [Candidatus Manganitrophaceae bacterium]